MLLEKKLTCKKKKSVFENNVSAGSTFSFANINWAVLSYGFYMTAHEIVAFTLDQQHCHAPLDVSALNWPLGAATL